MMWKKNNVLRSTRKQKRIVKAGMFLNLDRRSIRPRTICVTCIFNIFSIDKTKLVRLSTASRKRKRRFRKHFFTWVQRWTDLSGGTEKDRNKGGLGKTRNIYDKLERIWNDSQLTRKTKIGNFKSNVIPVLFYGCETW